MVCEPSPLSFDRFNLSRVSGQGAGEGHRGDGGREGRDNINSSN